MQPDQDLPPAYAAAVRFHANFTCTVVANKKLTFHFLCRFTRAGNGMIRIINCLPNFYVLNGFFGSLASYHLLHC